MIYPECEKLRKAAPTSQKIGEFLEWLSEQGIHLATWGKREIEQDNGHCWEEDILMLYSSTTEKLLARFFDINLEEVEAERRDIMETLR